ncbi:MAG: tetratricopeptide repeat protein [Bacteroidales bacterium]|nr:tetratricopeptide repeat protein [Bacteroidales bacterium]
MRTAFILVILLFPMRSLMAQDDSRVKTLLAEADILIASNNLPEALNKTREVLDYAPENHPARQKQINIYFLMNDDKEAMRLTDESVRKYPDMAAYYYLRGVILNSKEKFSKALDDFSRAIELDSGDLLYRCYLGRGVSYMNLLEYDNALLDLTASIEKNDTVASSFHSRAMVNYELRDYAAAVSDFLKVLDLSEGNSALYFNLGMSYYRLDDMEKACPHLNKACSMGNLNACRMSLMECAKAIPVVR